MEFRKFLESLWGGELKYSLPEDKEQQLYDFYMYTVLLKTGDHQADYVINEIGDVLLPSLKQNLLDAVLFAIASEIRHILDAVELDTRVDRPIEEVLEDELGSSYVKLYKDYIKLIKPEDNFYFDLRKSKEDDFDSDWLVQDMDLDLSLDPDDKKENFRPKLDYRNASLSSSYDNGSENSYAAMRKVAKKPKDFVIMCETLFNSDDIFWKTQYGGKAWGKICEGWLKLYYAQSKPQMMIWIDHIYDLQHNTGTVFNKLKVYYKSAISNQFGGYDWLKHALDFKASIQNPYQLYPHISDQLKTIASRLLKIKYNGSLQDNEFIDLKEFLSQPFDFSFNLKENYLPKLLGFIDEWRYKNNYKDEKIQSHLSMILKNINSINYQENSLLDALNYFIKTYNISITKKTYARSFNFIYHKDQNGFIVIESFVFPSKNLPYWFDYNFSIIKPINFNVVLQAIKTQNLTNVYNTLLKQIYPGVMSGMDLKMFAENLINDYKTNY